MGKFKPIIIMKRILLAICVMAVSVVSYGQSSRAPFTFAWLSDVHLNSFAYAEDDLMDMYHQDLRFLQLLLGY